ncbi:MAG: 4-hydroxy-tetrahydrodipicolinate synthase, partial [Pseudomonadota bacterium]
MFSGVYTALVTPFKEGQIDFQSLEKLITDQLENSISGFVVCGTTGESVTLTPDEQMQVLKFVCDKTAGRLPILFGSGSNNTQKTIETSLKACEYPIDGLLVVVPYYNKPPQEGLVAHFTTVADAVPKPLILYNVPGRTITALTPESVIQLSKHPNIAGIKEADSNLENFAKYKDQFPS